MVLLCKTLVGENWYLARTAGRMPETGDVHGKPLLPERQTVGDHTYFDGQNGIRGDFVN